MVQTDFESVLQKIDQIFLEKNILPLTEDEKIILKGTWEGQEYQQIAEFSSYSESYLKRNLGPHLWLRLSEAFEQAINKRNFKKVLSTKSIQPRQQRKLFKQKKLAALRTQHQPLTDKQMQKLSELKLPNAREGKDLATAIALYECVKDAETGVSGSDLLAKIETVLNETGEGDKK
jgi:hypothetical protein